MRSKKATGPLDHIFYALSDPTRRIILTTLARGEVNVTDLAEHSNLALATISKHLKVLERAKLIRRKVSTEDARAFVFAPERRALDQATDWLEKHRRYWKDRFDELERFVSAPRDSSGRRRQR